MKGLEAATRLFGPEVARAMLGCDWGTQVSIPGDREPCPSQATRRMGIHRRTDGTIYELKVCARHHQTIVDVTNPPGEGCGVDAAV